MVDAPTKQRGRTATIAVAAILVLGAVAFFWWILTAEPPERELPKEDLEKAFAIAEAAVDECYKGFVNGQKLSVEGEKDGGMYRAGVVAYPGDRNKASIDAAAMFGQASVGVTGDLVNDAPGADAPQWRLAGIRRQQ